MDSQHLQTTPCPLCGSTRREEVWTFASGVTNGLCLDCGHVYLSRRPGQAAIEDEYKNFKQCYPIDILKDKKSAIFQMAFERFRTLGEFLPQSPNSVLEIGCGYGHLLSLFSPKCLRVGIEPSGEQLHFAREHFKLTDIWESSYEQVPQHPANWPEKGFDLIISFHVLEHVQKPANLVDFSWRHLSQGGYLCLAVPNLFSLSEDLIELFFMAKGLHLHTFTPNSVLFLLEKRGFKVISGINEQPKPILRSSFLVVAQKDPNLHRPEARPSSVDQTRRAVTQFHFSLEAKLERLRTSFARWTGVGRRVAVYGGGVHTQALLELADIPPKAICLIIDDDPAKQGTKIQGIPVRSLAQTQEAGVHVIVVSSLASESQILERLWDSNLCGAEIVGVYSHLMGRSLKECSA